LFEEFRPYIGKRILEIGCGLGNQLRYFLDRELVVGIDISPESVSEVKHRFQDYPNVQAYELGITDTKVLSLADSAFDTALSVNVFEHIEDDILAFAHTYSILQSGGRFILIVPAHEWLYGTMDRSIGHYRRYTKNTLARKLEDAGFGVLHQKYVNMAGALGWLVNGRLLKRQVPPTGQLKFINTLVPALKGVERRFEPLFGVSLLSIAQK
jgi:SAM-dependent methyltransferase